MPSTASPTKSPSAPSSPPSSSSSSFKALIEALQADFPDVTIMSGEQFAWSPKNRSLIYNAGLPNAAELTLHEMSHGLLDHLSYDLDVELLAMEAAAWTKAKVLAKKYSVNLSEDIVQDHLDTYRDWMHARSTCPECSAVGYQAARDTYSCVACGQSWRVNEARLCGLKRYKQPKTPL